MLITVHFSSVAQLCLTLCDRMDYSTPGLPVCCQLESVMPSNHLIPCRPFLLLLLLLLLQSFLAPGSFPMSQFFVSSSQSIGVSASASVLPMNIQDWFPLRWTGWISLQSKGLSRVFSNTTVQKHHFLGAQLSLQSNSHIHTWLMEKLQLWLYRPLSVMFLLFNMLSRLVTAFLPMTKCLLISWLQSPSAVILEPQKTKSATVSPSICHEMMGPDDMIIVFWRLSFKSAFSLSSTYSGLLC